MGGTRQMVRRFVLSLILIGVSLLPRTAGAVSSEPTVRTMDRPESRQLLVFVGPMRERSERTFSTLISGGAAGAVVERSMVLHRIRAELTDSSGRPMPVSASWSARIAIQPQVLTPVARATLQLSAGETEISFPKPLGVRLEAGDSLAVSLGVADSVSSSGGALWVRLTLDYEPVSAQGSRIAVLPVELLSDSSDAGDAENLPSRSWEWQSATSGRILVLAGPAVTGAVELRLEDVATGQLVWRTSLPVSGSADQSQPRTVRLGARVDAGRSYRLTATYREPVAPVTSGESVRALMLPSRGGEG